MSAPESGSPSASGSRRNPLRGALIASLILNLFLVGAAAGWVLTGDRRGPPHPPPGGGGGEIGRMIQGLSEERREELKALFDAEREARRAAVFSLRETRKAVSSALEARPFAPEALRDALDLNRERGEALTLKVYEDLFTVMSRMPEAERAAYGANLRSRMQPPRPEGGPPPEGGHHGGRPPPPPP